MPRLKSPTRNKKLKEAEQAMESRYWDRTEFKKRRRSVGFRGLEPLRGELASLIVRTFGPGSDELLPKKTAFFSQLDGQSAKGLRYPEGVVTLCMLLKCEPADLYKSRKPKGYPID